MEIVALVHGDGGGPSRFRGILEGLGARVTDVRLHREEWPEQPPEYYDAVMGQGDSENPALRLASASSRKSDVGFQPSARHTAE